MRPIGTRSEKRGAAQVVGHVLHDGLPKQVCSPRRVRQIHGWGRLIVRRVKDARYPDALFPVWRYHPFFTNSTLPTAQADIVHRRHAIIETVFADLIDGPLAHLPSGHFGANSAWALCAALAHNLLHAAGTLASRPHSRARGATLRRQLIAVPARFARPARTPCSPDW